LGSSPGCASSDRSGEVLEPPSSSFVASMASFLALAGTTLHLKAERVCSPLQFEPRTLTCSPRSTPARVMTPGRFSSMEGHYQEGWARPGQDARHHGCLRQPASVGAVPGWRQDAGSDVGGWQHFGVAQECARPAS
jgi:hypothetical protein